MVMLCCRVARVNSLREGEDDLLDPAKLALDKFKPFSAEGH